MEYTYTVAFKVNGLCLPEGADEFVISESDEVQVIICSNTSKYSIHSDRGMAVGTLMFKGLTGQGREGEFEAHIEAEVNSIKEERSEKYASGPFIVFIAKGQTEVDLSKSTKEFGQFVILLDAVDKERIKASYKELINHHLTSLFLVAKRDFRVNKVLDWCHFEEDGKVFYSYTFSVGSPTVTVSNAFTDEIAEKLNNYLVALNKNTGLDDICRLLVRASSEQSDKLRSFIFAWTALEIFFNKTFKLYEQKFLEKHTIDSLPVLAQHFFERLRDVMKGKYSLRDKFIVIVSMLSDNADEDLQQFVNAKNLRDKLLHGEDVEESEFPINDVICLVRKYLALHLLKSSS